MEASRRSMATLIRSVVTVMRFPDSAELHLAGGHDALITTGSGASGNAAASAYRTRMIESAHTWSFRKPVFRAQHDPVRLLLHRHHRIHGCPLGPDRRGCSCEETNEAAECQGAEACAHGDSSEAMSWGCIIPAVRRPRVESTSPADSRRRSMTRSNALLAAGLLSLVLVPRQADAQATREPRRPRRRSTRSSRR